MFNRTTAQNEATEILNDDIRNVLLYGGSRSGKTFWLVRTIFLRALKAPGSRHVILRHRFAHAKQSLWYDTIPKVNLICFDGLVLKQNKQDWFFTFPNGSELWVGGLDDKDRVEKILGNEYATIYYNEISQISYAAKLVAQTRLAQKTELVNKEYYDCNPPTKSHWSYKLFFEHKDPLTGAKLANPEQYQKQFMHPESNRENLSEGYIENSLLTLPTKQRKRFYDGIYQDDLEGALWNYKMINDNRLESLPPDLDLTTAIAIDPAVTKSETSDETGVIYGGKANGHYYILADKSGVYSPLDWANVSCQMYRTEKVNTIVGETNNGGDLVEMNIKTVDPAVSFQKVWASKGKIKRAEPVASLYEQNLVHHVGHFPDLENEMTDYTGADGDKSPNRLDALVWLVNHLIEHKVEQSVIFTPTRENRF